MEQPTARLLKSTENLPHTPLLASTRGQELEDQGTASHLRGGQMTSSSFDERAKGKHPWLFSRGEKKHFHMVVKRNTFLRLDRQKSMLQSKFPECFQKPPAKPVARTSAFDNTLAGSLQAVCCCCPVVLWPVSSTTWCSARSHPFFTTVPAASLIIERHKRGHKSKQLFMPEWCLSLDSLPVPSPLSTLVYTPHRCSTLKPASLLKCLAAAAGPLGQASFPRLSLLLRAEGWPAAPLPSHAETLKPSTSHINCTNPEKEGSFPPFSGCLPKSMPVPSSSTPEPLSHTWLLRSPQVHPWGGRTLSADSACWHLTRADTQHNTRMPVSSIKQRYRKHSKN